MISIINGIVKLVGADRLKSALYWIIEQIDGTKQIKEDSEKELEEANKSGDFTNINSSISK